MIRKIRKVLLVLRLDWHWFVIGHGKKQGKRLLLEGTAWSSDELIRLNTSLHRHSVCISRLNESLEKMDPAI